MSAAGVDLSSCDREPIHVPGAIQPFGALLVLDADARVLRRSENAQELLGALPPLGEALGSPYTELLSPWLSQARDARSALDPVELTLGTRTFDLVAHHSGDYYVVEFEPREQDAPPALTFALKAQRALDRIHRQQTLASLLEVATEELFALTGFDRVMAYRFLHDDSGHVFAERRRQGLETFLGLRYPASDIPAQARRLFALNRLRFIPDLGYAPVQIEPASGPEAAEPLDLSQSMLRSVSPIHVEYLRNMEVTGSMSISIVAGGRLWGLFACHHYSGARLVPHAVRAACALLGQVVSVLVERAEIEQRARSVESARALREQVGRRAKAADDVVAALGEEPSFVGLVDACGGAVVWERRVLLVGKAPPGDVVAVLCDWLREKGDDVASSSALGAEVPALESKLAGVAGVLAVRFHREQDGWLLWFRPEEAETVRWAGNPEKTYSEGPLGPRLNPRGSFGEWRETVRGRAAPWLSHELEIAGAFRLDLQEVALGKLSELERARDLMLAALGHDLRSPLSAISMAAHLLSDRSPASVAASSSEALGQRIARSSGRMRRLVDQMLDLSRIQSGLGLGLNLERGNLAAVVQQAVEEARMGFPGTELEVVVPAELHLRIDVDRMAQVVSNLLSNARHHGKTGRPVHVELSAGPELAVLSVTNEGGPIPPATRARIFQPFKIESLGERRNRSGLGLGLHIVNEIVRSHSGRVEIDDAAGRVTFRIVLPIERPTDE
jgi:light-regulated signal transduction histidine kinase (bacteriophytochrome)